MMQPRKEMETNKKRKRKIEEEIIRSPPCELNLIQQLLLPWEMKRKIDDIEWHHHDIKLVIERKLCKSDVTLCGFIIPEYEILEEARDFLKPNEVKDLKMKNKSVKLLDQNLKEYELYLSWWDSGGYYKLSNRWMAVVRNNDLKLDEKVQLWSFRRVEDKLGFALVKLSP
ncbi:hypothetical protein K1719_002749 [Acacia pycnantha]|nr:hypothetical protein K1719_002749 [Acacia pycnantha]